MDDGVVPDLVPARILNEHVYCPRLAFLEWVDRRFEHNADTAEGTWVHRRVDDQRGRPSATPGAASATAGADSARPRSTAVTVGSERLGLIARIDLLESSGEAVVPVEYKRGSPRDGCVPLWEPEHVQLCAQVLLLRDAGYLVDHAEVYFAETRTRHRIECDDAIIERTQEAIAELRANARREIPPPPLVDSPKCPRCSLVGICLPDEVGLLTERRERPPRRLVANDSPATPLYATTPGSRLTKRGGTVLLKEKGETVASRRLIDISHIAVFGNVDVGSALLRSCFDAGTPILWLSSGGWLSGLASAMPPGNVQVRIRQHRAASVEPGRYAARFVEGKIRNQRTMLRRHGGVAVREAVAQLARLAEGASSETERATLLGIEGTAARIYFSRFSGLLRGDNGGAFRFEERNRRPPRDRVNALLSLAYAMLVKDTVIALAAVGLDPFVGLFHRPRFGRPSLALDLAEEFRPLIADSVVLTAINNGELGEKDFVERAGGVALTAAGRKRFLAVYERRMATIMRHPVFAYRASYRRVLEIQARLLAATLVGEVPDYRPLTTR